MGKSCNGILSASDNSQKPAVVFINFHIKSILDNQIINNLLYQSSKASKNSGILSSVSDNSQKPTVYIYNYHRKNLYK
jgi:hypothetical protein